MPRSHVLGWGGVSVAIGMATIACSSVIVDNFRVGMETCNIFNLGKSCTELKYWVAAGSLGIIGGSSQMAAMLLSALNKTKLWSGVHVMVGLLCMSSFGIALAHAGFGEHSPASAKGFTAVTLIDGVFALLASVVMYHS